MKESPEHYNSRRVERIRFLVILTFLCGTVLIGCSKDKVTTPILPTSTPTVLPSPTPILPTPTLLPTEKPPKYYAIPYLPPEEGSSFYNKAYYLAGDPTFKEDPAPDVDASFVTLDPNSKARIDEAGLPLEETYVIIVKAWEKLEEGKSKWTILPPNSSEWKPITILLVHTQLSYSCTNLAGGDTCHMDATMLIELPDKGDTVLVNGNGTTPNNELSLTVGFKLDSEGQILYASQVSSKLR
jgi:hypothetical protein